MPGRLHTIKNLSFLHYVQRKGWEGALILSDILRRWGGPRQEGVYEVAASVERAVERAEAGNGRTNSSRGVEPRPSDSV
jgi:hypothetical protein